MSMQDEFHSSEMVIKNNEFSEMKEFICEELGIGVEQEEKFIV